MNQRTRLIAGIGVLVLIVLVVMGIDALRRAASVAPPAEQAPGAPAVTLVPGNVPVYLDGQLIAGFSPAELDRLEKVSFIEPVEGVKQEGWMLRNVLLLYLPADQLQAGTQITVSSSSRDKSALLTWAEVDTPENMVMFDLANRGTLKLVSKLEKLDTRNEWVQDVDKIEVTKP